MEFRDLEVKDIDEKKLNQLKREIDYREKYEEYLKDCIRWENNSPKSYTDWKRLRK